MASKKQKSPGYTQADYSIDAPDYVIAELRYDSGIVVTSANGFRAAEPSTLRKLLNSMKDRASC